MVELNGVLANDGLIPVEGEVTTTTEVPVNVVMIEIIGDVLMSVP